MKISVFIMTSYKLYYSVDSTAKEALDLNLDLETAIHDKTFVIFLQPPRQILKKYRHSPTYIRVAFHRILHKSYFI
jgi:hypothetical protein